MAREAETETREKVPAERGRLSRDRIVAGAVRVMDEDGLDAVTMRRIGREVGCEAMSLYNHVRDKEDVLVGIIESVLSEFELPGEDAADWVERLRLLARAFRRVLLAHPNVLPMFSEHHGPMTSVDAFMPIEMALAALRGAGLSPQETTHAYRALVGYVLGYVTVEAGGFFTQEADRLEEYQAAFRALPLERIPTTTEMVPYLLRCDPDVEFEYGLDTLLAGLRAKLAR